MVNASVEEMNTLLGEAEAGKNAKEEPDIEPNGVEEEDPIMPESSDLSDVPSDGGGEEGSETGSATPSATSGTRPKSSSRQKDLRQKAHNQAHAKQREAARAKVASAKQALADHRKLDEEVNKLERRLEGIEREFRKLLGSVRVKPMGRDRFYNRIWWFDGMGSASLLGSGGVVQYGTGRLFVQGPSEFDVEMLQRREPGEIEARRKDEEGAEGMLAVGEWAVYTDLEEVQYSLNPRNVKPYSYIASNLSSMSLLHGSIQKDIVNWPSRTSSPNGGRISHREFVSASQSVAPILLPSYFC
jgi:bromodomain adjacent to zinc finger domain protein 1A